jgi:hypothetical protein
MDRGCRLHGLARREGDFWVSIVLDYDVIGTGDTPDEAIRTSVELAVSYIKEQLATGKELGALRHPAPLRYRLRYSWLRIAHAIRSHWDGPSHGVTFDEPLPALGC